MSNSANAAQVAPSDSMDYQSAGKQPIVRTPYKGAGVGSSTLAAVSSKSKENWMNSWMVILAGLVAAILVALIFYYTATNLLTVVAAGVTPSPANGLFTSSNWLTIGSGALFFIIVAITLAAAGSAVGMSWKNNGDSAMWTMGATLLMGIVYYFVFASARDDRKDQFAFWSFLATIIAIVVPGYGWWQTRSLNNDLKANPGDYDNMDKENIPKRSLWSMITFGVAVVFALITAAGLYKIYGALP